MDIEAVNTPSEYDKEITSDICPNWKYIYIYISFRSTPLKVFFKKVFRKYLPNLQKKIQAEMQFH